jgi:hypothetical protein
MTKCIAAVLLLGLALPQQGQAQDEPLLLPVVAEMFSGPLVFFATGEPEGGFRFDEPIPFGFVNNEMDQGWIWPRDARGGDAGSFTVDFGDKPAAVTRFRSYTVYAGGERGGQWTIDYSDDNLSYTEAVVWPYVTSEGGGVDDNGTPFDHFGGWYEVNFNEAQVLARYWRVTQTDVLVDHSPRVGVVQFWGTQVPDPVPSVASVSPVENENTVKPDAIITIKLEDFDREGVVNPVDPDSIELKVNGAVVTPSISKDGLVTTITYDPDPDLMERETYTVDLAFDGAANPQDAEVKPRSWQFTVVDLGLAGANINLDFNGVRNNEQDENPDPDVPGPTYIGQSAGGGGGTWNDIQVDSRVAIDEFDDDDLTITAENLLNSCGDPTGIGFTITPVGGAVGGSATQNARSRQALVGDYLFVGFAGQFTLISDFEISGLDDFAQVDLYFYTGGDSNEEIIIDSLIPSTFVPRGIFTGGNTVFFQRVPVVDGKINGMFNGDPGFLGGLTIKTPLECPFVSGVSPVDPVLPTGVVISVDIEDFVSDDVTAELNPDSVKLFVNDAEVTHTISKEGTTTTVTYEVPGALPLATNTARVEWECAAVPTSEEFAFKVLDPRVCPVTADMLSGSLDFHAGINLVLEGHANPIPYGFENNLNDQGWIWPRSDTGDGTSDPGFPGVLFIDLGEPKEIFAFRGWSSFTGGSRGGRWRISSSQDDNVYTEVATFDFVTTSGGGVDDRGNSMPSGNFGGWYSINFNPDGAAAQYWEVLQIEDLVSHSPRVAEVQFLTSPATPEPFVLSSSPLGPGVSLTAPLQVVLRDNATQVAGDSIEMMVDGTVVAHSISMEGKNTIVSFDPAPALWPQDTSFGSEVNVSVSFGDTSDPQVVQVHEYKFTTEAPPECFPLLVTGNMLAGSLEFLATPDTVNAHADPIPYGVANNVTDGGWIWPQENTGTVTVDFGGPQVVNGFSVWSSFPGDGRGARWAIEYSNDGVAFEKVSDFDFVTTAGGGRNDDGGRREDYGGWYENRFNHDSAIAAQFWRVSQTDILVSHAPRAAQIAFCGPFVEPCTVGVCPLPVTGGMLSGSLEFFASPAIDAHADPIPYGIGNNVADQGWIWPQDNSGFLTVDYGVPQVLTGFRVWSSFPGDGRGARWVIECSKDDEVYSEVAIFDFVTTQGGGLDDSGNPRPDFGGWYGIGFNPGGIVARYWRVAQVEILVGHAPRAAEVEFIGPLQTPPVVLNVTAEMLSGPLVFFASPVIDAHADPIPYGIENNVADSGWIWPQDNTGALTVDFGQPEAVAGFRAWSSFAADSRGASWLIEYSDDGETFSEAGVFDFVSTRGGGVNDDGSRRDDWGGWFTSIFNAGGTAAQYWRVSQVGILVGHAPRVAQVQFLAPPLRVLDVGADSLSGPLVFFASPAVEAHADPIPYGFENNVADSGWIWPQDNTGELTADFGQPEVVQGFRAWSSFAGDGRGASWLVEYSDDGETFSEAGVFDFVTTQGGGVNDDSSPRDDWGGWYGTRFNATGVAAQFWRVSQVEILVSHSARVAQVQFLGPLLPPAQVLDVGADMLSGPLDFFASPAIEAHAEPIPYGFANNLTDGGWIWPNENTGLLDIDFGGPQVVLGFRVWSAFPGDGRGARWAIQYSDNGTDFTDISAIDFVTVAGGGLNDDSTQREDYGGWYGVRFNNDAGVEAQYWRIAQVEVLVGHGPRTAEFQLLGLPDVHVGLPLVEVTYDREAGTLSFDLGGDTPFVVQIPDEDVQGYYTIRIEDDGSMTLLFTDDMNTPFVPVE